MDLNNYQPGFGFVGMGNPSLSTLSGVQAVPQPPPQPVLTRHMSAGSEDISFNDSGYFSSPPKVHGHQFTGLNPHPRAATSTATMGQAGHHPGNPLHQPNVHSPSKLHGSIASDLMGVHRPSWQDDFPNDEWDKNFINSFEENLFGFDAADLSSMVDGLMGSPMRSPHSSPRLSRSAAAGLGLSPFNNLSTSNVMLSGARRSPARSPFKSPYPTPSPVKGLNYTRPSHMTTRQRRLFQSPPSSKSDSLLDSLSELPSFLGDSKEECGDDLGVVPFQRTNSFGFTPNDEDVSSSPTLSYLQDGNFLGVMDAATPSHSYHVSNVAQQKRLKLDGDNLGSLSSDSVNDENLYHYGQHSSLGRRRSPARLAQSRISITQHSHLINSLPPKDALRMVRARFTEALEKATADAVLMEKNRMLKLKASERRKEQVQSTFEAAGSSDNKGPVAQEGFPTSKHRSHVRRRQEILPKPPDWQRKEPCKIAPKKRRR